MLNAQVLALVISPSLIDNPPPGFEADVVARARAYHSALPGSGMGAYSNSQGTALVRQEVAEFINQRDGMQGEYASPEKIFLTDGASSGVKNLMVALIRGGSEYSDGVMVPIPQYPLYSALSTLAEGVFVPYYLDESAGWETQVEELKVCA
jgi:glutamate--glyoxylate aminotransferase